jgi:acyl carrier protein
VAAVVVARPGSDPTERELRELVAIRLAPHKVPRRVLLLDSIPLGPTGKPQRIGLAQRLGLSDLDGAPATQGGRAVGAARVAPRDPVEELVAGLWAEVLGVDGLSVHDHFLECGGDSLAATRLLSRLRDELDLEVSLLDFFDAPTIAEQAALVASVLRRDASG